MRPSEHSTQLSFALWVKVPLPLSTVSLAPFTSSASLQLQGRQKLHSICQQIWKTQQWPQHWKRSVFIPIPKKGNAKECSNYCTIAVISHASKVILKILQVRLQQYVNHELPDVQAGFRKRQRNQRSNC